VDDYIRKWEEWEWLPGVLDAVKLFSSRFGRIVVVTNQRGIARGLMTADNLADIHARMQADIARAGGKINWVLHCPHDKDMDCGCRKPQPGMFHQAQKQLPDITTGRSVMLGDSSSDMGFAENAGIHGIAVGPAAVGGEFRVADLAEFAELLKNNPFKMNKATIDAEYWKKRWENADTPWDIGYATPAITKFVGQLPNKDLRILIPGAGNAYEADWLWRNGFQQVDVVDFSPIALGKLKERIPEFPDAQLLAGDFFNISGTYDLILEQTFFCAIDVALRPAYVQKMAELLHPGGVLAGVMFDFPLTAEGPPFGGSREEYEQHFSPYFQIRHMEICQDSILPRQGREFWVEFVRK
jgi:histidinol-phosphate phosphatase family protein